ncbi:phage holin family protein [Weissella tructae]|jgi:putative membrane protein|uniref:Membrane protein n=2 Tax=Weissella TaxID=46255 RepID=A0ABN4DI07_9LACO|nr:MULTISPECIES: phage holin family protein [Weissella]AIG65127.1 Putative membrane protein [Weissella tructae]AIM62440.1 Putative membrane protein [Weissella ceti]AIM63777.1 Putative membrane protein [Weissella ceti]ELA07890.1 hypothetical protein WCNC_00310 [Weissella ceti NC36]QVV91516.1 phage holin family protein [Weissella tructae]
MRVYSFQQLGFSQRVLVNTLTLLALAGLFPQGLYMASIWTALWAAVVLGVLNALLRPILQLLALPLTILTFGVFGFVVNAAVLWLASSIVGTGFQFMSFSWALLISMIMAAVNFIITNYLSSGK